MSDRHKITDLAGNAVSGINTLAPPLSILKLVHEDPKADAEWKKWLNGLYDYLGTLNQAVLDNMSKDYALEVSRGNISGQTWINKFGRNTDIDTVQEDVWDGGGTYTFSTTADITHVVSSNAGDTFDVEVNGLDTNWAEVTQTKTLTGTTGVALDTALIRVNRMKNPSATAAAGNVQCGVGAVTTAFTAGNLRAQVTLGFEQTEMAIYSVPTAKTAYMTNKWANINKANASGALDCTLWARTFGGVFRAQPSNGLIAAGSSHFQHLYNPYPAYTAKTDLKQTGIGSTNNFDISAGFDLILVDD